MRLSYSALATFQRCPLKFKFEYIERIRTPKSKEALFGTLIHSTLKKLHEPGLLIPTEEEILKFFADNWDQKNYTSELEASTNFSQGVKILKDYYAKNYPANFNIVALETSFAVPLKAAGETHLLAGKIDRVDKTSDGLFEVIDYKTAKKMPSQQAVENDLQLAIYHLGTINQWPMLEKENRPVKVSFYFLKHGEKLSAMRNAEQLAVTKENAIRELEEIVKARKAEKFEPRPNPLCDWCGYQRYCPLFKHKFIEQKIIFNDQDIKKLLNEYISLDDEIGQKEKRLAEMKGTFSLFMDQSQMERLFSEDGYITRKLIQRFKYDPDLLRQILEPLGKWQEILKVDDAKLKKVAKEVPASARAKIEEAKKLDKEYKSFSVKKEKT
jgi:RecB family exonuclease